MERIGRYRVVGELGRGAMGVVYRAEDPAIGRTVAIKTIKLGDLTDDSEVDFMRERLRREARSAGILSHPGIVTIYDIFEEGDTAYVLMEFVNGETLDRMVAKDGKLPKEQIFDILRQTAAALDYAHGKGIVHRDIKPANIMFSVDGEAKITDFGVAKILSQQMTQTRSVLGTPYYMSPEQIQGGHIDGQSDQFALAVIAFELMTGERPYSADALPTLLFKIVKEDPPAPERLNPSLAPEVGTVFERAFAKEPEGRFAGCTEFVNALAMATNRRPDWQPLTRADAGQLETAPSAPPMAAPPPEPEPTLVADASQVAETRVAEPPVLPQIPRTRDREALEERRESHLFRNVMLAVFFLALIGGGVYAYLEYFQPLPRIPQTPGDPIVAEDPRPVRQAGEETPGAPAETATSPAETPTPPPAPPGETTPESVRMAEEAASLAPPPEPAKEQATPPAPEVESPKPEPPKEAVVTQPPKPASPKPTPPPKPKQYWVQVRSVPSGADVSIENHPDLDCKAPCEMPLKPGRYVLNFSMAGHRMAPRIINVPEVTDVTARLDQQAGTLAIRTTPPGAAIFINGEERAEKTPAMIKLPAGNYNIRLTLAGHPNFEDSVEVRDQVITSFGVDW